jgi:hypothetical protein
VTVTPRPRHHDATQAGSDKVLPLSLALKSDLRNHQAIVQPRLYDCLMVTQITLQVKTEPGPGPHAGGFDSCQGHKFYGKVAEHKARDA